MIETYRQLNKNHKPNDSVWKIWLLHRNITHNQISDSLLTHRLDIYGVHLFKLFQVIPGTRVKQTADKAINLSEIWQSCCSKWM